MFGLIVVAVVLVVAIGPYVARWPGRPEWMSTWYGWLLIGFIAFVGAALLLPTFGK